MSECTGMLGIVSLQHSCPVKHTGLPGNWGVDTFLSTLLLIVTPRTHCSSQTEAQKYI